MNFRSGTFSRLPQKENKDSIAQPQSGEMFIDHNVRKGPRSVGAQCFLLIDEKIALLRSLGNFRETRFYKHFVPTGLRANS